MVIRDLSMAYGDRTLFSKTDLLVRGGEHIAFLGDNGTGKSTFLKLLVGEEQPKTGRIRFGPSVKLAYLPQIIHFAHPERSVLDTLIYEKNYSTQAARNRLGAFLFSGEDVFKPVAALSGGEMSRLRLCMLMDEEINFLILDEPTNHLDIASREWIENAVAEFPGTLLFVSHDRYFIDQFADHIWELEDGKISVMEGTYQQYRAMKQRQAQEAQAQAEKSGAHREPARQTRRKDNSWNPEREIALLEQKIEKQENLLKDYDDQIQEAATDYEALTRLMAEQETAQAELDDLYARWEELSELSEV